MRLLDLARRTAARAKELGADEVSVSVARATEVSLARRAGKLERAEQATSLGVSLSLLLDDRYSAHSTSDLRPEAMDAFLQRAIAATKVLEPEPERRQAPIEWCGRGVAEGVLDQRDPSWEALTVEQRREYAINLEAAVDALPNRAQLLSATVSCGDSIHDSARVMSNGFEDEHTATGFGAAVEITLEEPGGRRPEGMSWYGSNHRGDIPGVELLAKEAYDRAAERLGSHPIASGRYPMLLQNHCAGRVLGTMMGPLSGSELHQGRSCLAGKIGEQIASSKLSILDNPLIPRGAASRPFDGDALRAKPMPVLEAGVLRNYYISVYYARKLGVDPTTGGRSNWEVTVGTRTPQEILADLPSCIVVTGFLGGNSNGLTGDFSFGVQGLYVEHGEIKDHISEMNVSGNVLEIFHQYAESATDVWKYGATRTPSLLFDGVQFSGT